MNRNVRVFLNPTVECRQRPFRHSVGCDYSLTFSLIVWAHFFCFSPSSSSPVHYYFQITINYSIFYCNLLAVRCFISRNFGIFAVRYLISTLLILLIFVFFCMSVHFLLVRSFIPGHRARLLSGVVTHYFFQKSTNYTIWEIYLFLFFALNITNSV